MKVKALPKVLFINIHPDKDVFRPMVPLTFGQEPWGLYWHNWDVVRLTKDSPRNLDLPRFGDYKAAIITGSSLSIISRKFDPPVWKKNLIEWIKTACYKQAKILGVCAGAEVLTLAFGGKLEPMEKPEFGWGEADLKTEGAKSGYFPALYSPFVVGENHSVTTAYIAPGALLFAENDLGVEAFGNQKYLGVMFHPERTPETTKRLVSESPEKFQNSVAPERFEEFEKNYNQRVTEIFSLFLKKAFSDAQ